MKNNLIFDLGKIIGLDKDYLEKLNNEYQEADKDRRYQIMDILWKGVFRLLDDITKIKYRQLLEEVALGKRKLESDLYQQAYQEAKNYLFKILTGEIDDEQKIDEIRKKIMLYAKN